MKKQIYCLLALSFLAANMADGDAVDQEALVPFKHAPYPLSSKRDANKFFDVVQDGRRGHNSPRGGLLWEDTTYNDNRVLISIPAELNTYRTPTLVIFLHGNQSTLMRDVIEREKIPKQITDADINAILVAPQFAVDALDSNSGNFSRRNYFSKFLQEANAEISKSQHSRIFQYYLDEAPIIIVAYSGGYLAAAQILKNGGANNRIRGVILMDALYGQEQSFADWLSRYHHHAFFFSAYSEPARASNETVMQILKERHIKFDTGMPEKLHKGNISFFQLNENIVHKDLLTQAWSSEPITDLLRKARN